MGIFDFLKSSKNEANDHLVSNSPESNENWVTYVTTIDNEHLGSILVDLSFRQTSPIDKLDQLLVVEVPLLTKQENGLPHNNEFEVLRNVEDAVESALRVTGNDVFVGHLYCQSVMSLYHYVPANLDPTYLLADALKTFDGYTHSFRLKPDSEWNGYFDFLCPSPLENQRIGNDMVIANLVEHGDLLDRERQVDHWIYFNAESDRSSFLVEVESRGHKVEELYEDKEFDPPLKVQISRNDKVTTEATDEYILDLWQLANDHNGVYDGWETFIVKE